MNISDFETNDSEAFVLKFSDELVEHGMPRDVAKVLMTRLAQTIDGHFDAAIKSFDDLADLDERAFVKSCFVVWLYDWAKTHLALAATAQNLSLYAIIDRG